MQRLTGLDAGFLSMETPTSPMHVASLAVFDPSDVDGGWSIDQVKEVYGRRLHLAAPFRRRLVEVPFGLHHPLWIEDPDFDLDWHIRHIAVPAPGGPRELAALAGHLVALPLDRSRPLWEMWVIEGLEQGHVAVLSKVHHAAIDGASGNDILVATLDLEPDPPPTPEPDEPWEPDRVPSDPELLTYGATSLARQPFRVAKASVHTARSALDRSRLPGRPGTTPPPGMFSAPRTSINTAITGHRSYAMATVSLPEVKAVKNAFGVTVNDVVLGMCGGALRRYFDAIGEEVEGALVAMVPVSVRTEDQEGTLGNRVSSVLATLATDRDDPVERLQAIHEAMDTAKERHAVGADALQDWAEFAAPALLGRAARLYSTMRVAGLHRPVFNVTISNVPGPPFPLYSAGARLVANYPVGPIFDGAGLNMTVMSYQESLDFGLLACPDVLPDVWTLADGLTDALAELTKAARKATR
ncbi:MAG TPA: wax ester/triacylglycerol synthase family O-acyltransferase [Acidimicrobiales bacterium]|nr:wax ester/triacylglycerol synthase family O-acyltransferase [Acidimicrobiales bacterium]